MSESTELSIRFTTTNKNPEQELQGIFNNHWQPVIVKLVPKTVDMFYVRILELNLIESLRAIKGVVRHCKKNKREIAIDVTHGSIWWLPREVETNKRGYYE